MGAVRDPVDDAVISDALETLQWERDGDRLRRTVKREDFSQAMVFANRVADLAEEVGHHPDISISWNTVTLTLWTHVTGGITSADLDLARRIDALG